MYSYVTDSQIAIYNEYDGVAAAMSIENIPSSPTIGSGVEGERWEFIKDGIYWHAYVDGEFKKTVSVADTDYGYFGLRYTSSHLSGQMTLKFDNFGTESNIGCNPAITNVDNLFYANYGLKLRFLNPDSTYMFYLIDTADQTVIDSFEITGDQQYCGSHYWDVSDTLGTNYSIYQFKITKDGITEATNYFSYMDVQDYGSIEFDADAYVLNEEATINYELVGESFDTYEYWAQITDLSGEQIYEEEITDTSGSLDYTWAEDVEEGTYYLLLVRKFVGSEGEYLLDYDYADVTESVTIAGNTLWFNETASPNADVVLSQAAAYSNTTSDSSAAYEARELSVGVTTSIYAENSSLAASSSPITFTPLYSGMVDLNLVMFPDNMSGYWDWTYNNTTYSNPTLYGLAWENYHQPVSDASITLSNATWNSSTITLDETGFYAFHNLTNGQTYTVVASKTAYDDVTFNVTIDANTRYDFEMTPVYAVTIKAQDSDTFAYLSDFDTYVNGNDMNSTTTGSVVYYVPFGVYSFSAAASDYYADSETYLIDSDRTVILELDRVDSVYYSPHYVRFVLSNIVSTYSDVDVAVYEGDDTTETYTGITGSDGAVGFKLYEDRRYRLEFTNETRGIDRTWAGYPVDSEYIILVFPDSSVPDDRDVDDILFGCYGSAINLSAGYINVSFNDTSTTTALAELWINDTNQTNLYYFNTTNTSYDWSQVVNASNNTYVVAFKITNTALDEPLTITRVISFYQNVRFSLGFVNGWNYVVIAVAILVFVAALFSRFNAYAGAVIIALGGGFFIFIGWLTAGMTFEQQVTMGVMWLFGTLIAFGSAIRSGEGTQ